MINLNKTLYASCRVRTRKALGSATIVSSHAWDGSNYETYAITNHHVVEDCIAVKKEFDPLVGREVPKEFKALVEVDFPRFNKDKLVGFSTVLADIVIYDKHQDVALLKFRDTMQYPSATLIPESQIDRISILQSIVVIGNPLGEKLVATSGMICGTDIEIENYDFWLGAALQYFGVSGGGVFTEIDEDWYYIGVPSRVKVALIGLGMDVVSHLGYFIPPTRLWKWLKETCYEYVADPSSYNKTECEQKRQKRVEEELAKLREVV